jgi:hypothetical protein
LIGLASDRDVPRLLQSFCHRAREFVGARLAVLCILDDARFAGVMPPNLFAELLVRLAVER